MGHTGEPGADALRQAAGMYEWLLKEERQRTTTMTLANADKRQQIRTMLKVLVAIVRRAEVGESIAPDSHEIKAARVVIADLQSRIEAAS